MVGRQATGIGAISRQDHTRGVDQKARRNAAGQARLWVVMPRYFKGLRCRDMAEGQVAKPKFNPVAATKIDRARIMVAFNPGPNAASHQAGKPEAVGVINFASGGKVIETVAEADDVAGLGRLQIGVKAGQGGAGFVRREQAATAPGETFGLAEVQIRDGQQVLIGPVKGAGGQGGQLGWAELEDVGHGFRVGVVVRPICAGKVNQWKGVRSKRAALQKARVAQKLAGGVGGKPLTAQPMDRNDAGFEHQGGRERGD